MNDLMISLGNWVKLAVLVVVVTGIVYICCTDDDKPVDRRGAAPARALPRSRRPVSEVKSESEKTCRPDL